MKKKILSVTGLLAFSALMLFNVNVINTNNSSTIELSTIRNTVAAQSEGGVVINGDAHVVNYTCPNGVTKSAINCFAGGTVCVPQSNNCN